MSKQEPSAPKRRLGRGLDGLLPAASPRGASTAESVARIEELHRNRKQPRRRFDEASLEELAASIREHGILEPILVRKRREGGGYEIIAGERRWRAAQRAGLHEVPIFVRELSDENAFQAAIVENLQREDLNPIETARAFRRLRDEFGMTGEQIAQRVGKSRAAIANSMRLLELPELVLDLLETGAISEGHGRAILQAPDEAAQIRLAKLAASKRLSVRDVERLAREAAAVEGARKTKAPAKPVKSANIRDLEERLTKKLGCAVRVQDQGGRGTLEIDYGDLDELDRILGLIGG